ncbi:MAG: HNH endonuclease [Cytophagales bacterium]|nr:HNH endonuclease [Cytophagales bacterium]
MIDNKLRYQKGLALEHLFPKRNNECACGCGNELEGRKRKWYSDYCRRKSLYIFYIVKGDTKAIREILYQIDKGFCRCCGVYDEFWEADHIIPVYEGGGACFLDNLQTLCKDCHQEKTSNRIPNSYNVKATSLNISKSILDSSWTLNESILEDIIRDTIIRT